MQLTFASYNIHKAVGTDRRRDPERILAVLREINADVIALQEVDRRFGRRASVLPRQAIEDFTPFRAIDLAVMPQSLGWHGNALLVRQGIELLHASRVNLPVLEPRGAVCAELSAQGHRFRVVGMHLDLSGMRRAHQLRAILDDLSGRDEALPAVLMGDLNEWALHGGCFRELGDAWQVLTPGPSFPSRRPVARLDRFIASPGWRVLETRVHHSALSARGSDHLPICAAMELPKK